MMRKRTKPYNGNAERVVMKKFFACAAAALSLAAASKAEKPELVVGVLSDIHIQPEQKNGGRQVQRLRKAFRFFDERKADAVVASGDMVELGWHTWLRAFGRIWFDAFPGNRRSDGQPIEKVFVYGDHEIENFWNPNITRRFSREYILARDIPTYGRGRIYEEALKEPWSPIMRKTVKGYDFVMAHFTMREDGNGRSCDDGKIARWGEYIPGLKEFFATNSPGRAKPFFYIQHKPIKDTVIAKGEATTDGSTRAILEGYPNAVALCGHRHKSATSEYSLWQGAFTCVQVPALECVQTGAGHENGWASADGYAPTQPPQQMPKIRTAEDGGQFLMMSVYRDRIVFERWNIDFLEKVAEDWIVRLPKDGECPSSFEARAAKAKPACFPDGAQVKVSTRMGPDRAGNTNFQYVVAFPTAKSDTAHSRGYDYRVTAEITKHHWTRVSCEKWVYSGKCYMAERHDTNDVVCVFSEAEIPASPRSRRPVRFTVTPYNAFGQPGRPISTVRE